MTSKLHLALELLRANFFGAEAEYIQQALEKSEQTTRALYGVYLTCDYTSYLAYYVVASSTPAGFAEALKFATDTDGDKVSKVQREHTKIKHVAP